MEKREIFNFVPKAKSEYGYDDDDDDDMCVSVSDNNKGKHWSDVFIDCISHKSHSALTKQFSHIATLSNLHHRIVVIKLYAFSQIALNNFIFHNRNLNVLSINK